MAAARLTEAVSAAGEDRAIALLSSPVAKERALALAPALSFLVRQAHQDGLEVVSGIIAEALDDILRWVEEDSIHEQHRSQDSH